MAIEKIYSKDDERLVLEIDRLKNRSVYHVAEGTGQAKSFEKIYLEGFVGFPKGFYREGFGLLKPAGTFLVQALKEAFGAPFEFSIIRTGKTKVTKTGRRFHIQLTHSDYIAILDGLKEIRSDANRKCKKLVAAKLHGLFPKYYKSVAPDSPFTYSEDRIAKILSSDPEIVEKLTKNDVTRVAEIYSELAEKGKLGIDVKDLSVVSRSKSVAEKVHLQQLTREFDRMLKKPNTSESAWQQFLQNYILLFNTAYVGVLEKMSVMLQGKYPDFMLLNVYNYIDIFEIKKPSTNVLKKDESRNNYYWDAEVSKAISQVENYIHYLSRNAATFRDEIQTIKGIDIKVVRPRGVVIVGQSTQLTSDKMRDDFRLLAGSLKNTDVILYDELLKNLKNLINRLTPTKRGRKKET